MRYATPKTRNGIRTMADHKHGEMDISVQEKTFEGFMKWVTWAVVVILLLIIWMAIFIT